MQFVRVRNFEKFQHYKNRNPLWIKLYNDLWGQEEFFTLDDAAKAHVIGFFALASRTNNRIPLNLGWIEHEIRASSPVDIDRLFAAKFIEPLGKSASKPASALADHVLAQSREEKNRVEKRREDTSLSLLTATPPLLDLGTGKSAPVGAKVRPVFIAFGEFGNVRLTEDEHAKLLARLNGSCQTYIDRLDRWGEEQPRKFAQRKSHYATLLNWYDRDLKEGRIPKPKPSRADIEKLKQEIFGK